MSRKSVFHYTRKDFLISLVLGVVALAVGGALTYVSYQNANPGETYTVYTGLFLFGGIGSVMGVLGFIFRTVTGDPV